MNWYAGIGSRRAPTSVLRQIELIAKCAGTLGWGLRSGAAQGCDTAFERGCDAVCGEKQIFLPWAGFMNHPSQYNEEPSSVAYEIASQVHPTYKRLSPAAKRLIARNMYQVLGPDLASPVSCVICWTPDGCESHTNYGRNTGGTGTAIVLASWNHIPIFNIYNAGRDMQALEFLTEL